MVLPFEVHALDALAYLESEIPKAIGEHLKQEGDIVLTAGSESDAVSQAMKKSLSAIRELGAQEGADFVVWGSLTWIGQSFSLDAKLASTRGDGLPGVFVQEGEGIANLLGAVRALARDLSVKLLRREKIVEVRVTGNQRIESDAIKRVVGSTAGEIYRSKTIPEDIKAIYAMGYFDDIRVEIESVPAGKIIEYTVKEKQTIRQVAVSGNRVFDDDEIMESINISTGSILNIFRVQNNIEAIETLYKERNYHNVEVEYSVRPLKNNQADLFFVVKEGAKLLIKEIVFDGNSDYTDEDLKDVIKTSEKGFFSFITSSGDLKMEDLEEDIMRLKAHYHKSGYITSRVGDPQIEYKDKWIFVTIKIEEGARYKVGNVDVAGELIVPKSEILELLTVSRETYYDRELMQNDTLAIEQLYANHGYAYPDIVPKLGDQKEDGSVDITYTITKGRQVYFEKIIIAGNHRTRDKVIRRQLMIHEEGLYNGENYGRSIRNLHRLEYFADVKADSIRGSADGRMVARFEVEEQNTGTFSLSGGYSSVENAFAMVSFEQRNLFGRGHDLNLTAQVGGRSVIYSLSFTEPWLFDIPLMAGFDIYNLERDYDFYDTQSMGIHLRSSYRIFDYTYAFFQYGFDVSDIRNLSISAPESVWQLVGDSVTSAVTTSIRYDSRDRLFTPTEGSNHLLSLEYAGLGGDIGFVKLTGESGIYVPLYRKLVFFAHGKGGIVREIPGFTLPDFERFALGGMNSVRGYGYREISPTKVNSFGVLSSHGGDKFMQFNFELLLPLMEETGLVAVAFFDAGDVYDNFERMDFGTLRQSAGFGFRWFSPMGPIRIEYAYILNPRPGDSTGGGWEFTMGNAF